MRLLSLCFEDPAAAWNLEEMEFFPDLTLLVGVSGVGKTRILESLMRLKGIASGDTSGADWGRSWSLRFECGGYEFRWSGRFRTVSNGAILPRSPRRLADLAEPRATLPTLDEEGLERDGQELARRDDATIKVRGESTPKLPREESLLHILRNEEEIAEARKGVLSLLYAHRAEDSLGEPHYPFEDWEYLTRSITTRDAIREAQISTRLKLALAYQHCRPLFDQIAAEFRAAFDSVKSVTVDVVVGPFGGPQPKIVLQEAGVSKPIPEDSISSGMARTLMHLARVALWPDGTVVLIDEFENSLGVNCIDFVTDDLLHRGDRLQFVLTSHHPYIINRVPMDRWKIVTRRGSTVSVQDSGLDGRSSHDAFLKLINSPAFTDGITAP